MTRRRDRGIRVRRRPVGGAPDAAPTRPGPGDPLVRALITCIREAHARRLAGHALD